MCGRYVSTSTPERLTEVFDVDEIRTHALAERFNVAPTQDVYAIIDTSEGERRMGALRWGFVPPWAPRITGRSPINARVEDIETKPMFRRAFARHRCILPADAFWEWQSRPDRDRRQPYHVAREDGRPFALAGIWSSWRDPDDEDADWVRSCAILTMDAVGPMRDVHHRMPVMLPERLWDAWLGTGGETPHLARTVASVTPPTLVLASVTDRVNNVRNEGPELAEPGVV